MWIGKANRKQGMLNRTFKSKEPQLWKDLYVSLVRPHLEYAVQAWNPQLKGVIDKVDKIKERKAIRILNVF